MKKPNLYLAFILGAILLSANCSKEQSNKHYPVNRSPLLQTKFVKLPLGSVKAKGWLQDQLIAQSQGLTGHLDEFWPDLITSAWKGGEGESWERGPYYLDGLIPLAYLLEDEVLIKKAKPWIEWILNSSKQNGWFGPEPNGDRWPLAIVMKVLSQYYEATNDSRALDVIKGYFEYLSESPPDWPDDAWRGVRAMEHAVSGYWLYRRTGDANILHAIESIQNNSFDWSGYFVEFPWDAQALQDNKIPHNWKSDGLTAHVVNVAMAIKYPGIWYQQAKDIKFRDALYQGIANLDKYHGQVGGRFSGDEHLSGKHPTQGTELCAVVEYMFSLEQLMEVFGDPAFGDRLESLAYNSLPGTITPDYWAHQYDQQANQVLVSEDKRQWSTNGNASNIYGLMPNYPCCLANMHQGWPKFVQHMWMATHDGGIVAIAYGPSVVTTTVGDGKKVTIIEETEYPFDGSIKFTIQMEGKETFPISFRIPEWAKKAELMAGGKTYQTKPGNFTRIKRDWRSGDVIKINFPLNIRFEQRYNKSLAVLRGPLYFSLRIGKKYDRIQLQEKNFSSINYPGSVDWEIRPTTPWNYGLLLSQKEPAEFMTVKTNPIQKYPFADMGEMIYSPEQNKYTVWDHKAPVEIIVKGKKIMSWNLENNSAADPPISPVKSDQREEELVLVPYGCARLRITEFPVIANNQD